MSTFQRFAVKTAKIIVLISGLMTGLSAAALLGTDLASWVSTGRWAPYLTREILALAHIGLLNTYVLSSANREVVQHALAQWLEVPAILPVLIAGILLILFYRAIKGVEDNFDVR